MPRILDEDLEQQANMLKQMGFQTREIADMLCITYERARYAVMTPEQRAKKCRVDKQRP